MRSSKKVPHYQFGVLGVIFTSLFFVSMDLYLIRAGVSPQEGKADDTTQVLVVNADSTDPGVPLDLALIIRLFPKEHLLEITARVGKHPAFPADLFFDKDVKVQIQLPPGLQLQAGSLSWQGELQGEEVEQFQAKVEAVGDMEGAVDALAVGYAAIGGRVDADPERFYVLVRGETMQISLKPLIAREHTKPGTGKPRE